MNWSKYLNCKMFFETSIRKQNIRLQNNYFTSSFLNQIQPFCLINDFHA